jgi:tetrahydromethanopterin S-methyltransferase subunit F
MANLIKQKYLEGIDSSKFKIEQGGAIKAENSSGQLVDVFKFDVLQNVVKIYNDKEVADTDFVNGLITQEISDRNSAIQTAISDLINGAPAALDTLKELADKLASEETALDALISQVSDVDAYAQDIREDFDALTLGMAPNTTIVSVQGQISDEATARAQEDETLLKLNGSRQMTGALQMNSNKIEGLAAGMMSTEAVNKGQLDSGVQEAKDYTDDLEDRALLLNGSQSMSGNLQMNSNKIEGLASGMMSTDAVNKGQLDSGVQEAKDYTDNLEDRALLLNGTQSMTGNLQMNSNKIEGLASGMMSTDAVNKGQLDSVETGLQGQIDTEKGRIDAILLASDADKDSFAEIVQLINSVDTTNDSAFASYVLSNDAALAQEVSDRIADVNAEETRALAAEGLLQGAIDAEVTARETADLDFFKYDGSRAMTGDIDANTHSVIFESGSDTASINYSKYEVLSDIAIANEGWPEYTESHISKIEKDLVYIGFSNPEVLDQDENLLLPAVDQKAEISPTEVKVSYLPEGGATQYVGKLSSYAFSVNEGSDQKGHLHVGLIGAGETTTWVNAINDIFNIGNSGGDVFIYGTNNVGSGGTEGHISFTAGESAFVKFVSESKAYSPIRLISVDENEEEIPFVPTEGTHAVNKAYVDSQISANKDFSKETFEIDVTAELSYIELAQTPVANSLVVFVNRLAVHEGEDYTVSVVDGVTRLTWAGEFAVGGIEAIELGDFIRVTYMY